MAKAQDLVSLQEALYSSGNPTRRWLHCVRRDWILAAMWRYRATDARQALEIGPGSGIYLPELASLYQQVYASDIESAYLENACQRLQHISNLNIRTDDITASHLPAGSFDFILCTEVIEHIKDSQGALMQMWRLLRQGGVLLLSTPQRYSPLEQTAKIAFLPGVIQLVRMIYNEPVMETGHINLLTESELRRQIDSAGFSVVESYKTGVYIPLVAEFLGELGLKMEQLLERKIKGSSLDWLLWTQYFVLRK